MPHLTEGPHPSWHCTFGIQALLLAALYSQRGHKQTRGWGSPYTLHCHQVFLSLHVLLRRSLMSMLAERVFVFFVWPAQPPHRAFAPWANLRIRTNSVFHTRKPCVVASFALQHHYHHLLHDGILPIRIGIVNGVMYVCACRNYFDAFMPVFVGDSRTPSIIY